MLRNHLDLSIDDGTFLKLIWKESGLKGMLDSNGARKDMISDFCENVIEPPGSVMGEEFLN
jgi:hypothetical protein